MKLLRTSPMPFPEMPSLLSNFINDDYFPGFAPSQRWLSRVPSANIKETEEEFVINLAAPGMHKKDFQIAVDGESLSISAEQKEEQVQESEQYKHKEFNYCSFCRSFALPTTVEANAIKATYDDGLLKISLPKKEATKQLPKQEIRVL